MNNPLQQLGNIPVTASVLESLFPHIRGGSQKLRLLERDKQIIRLKKGLYVCNPEITGKTLSTVKAMLEERGASSVEIVTLLDKKEGRLYPIEAKYVGFEIPNAFVIGFGLDFNEKYRNLPYVGILKEECYQ